MAIGHVMMPRGPFQIDLFGPSNTGCHLRDGASVCPCRPWTPVRARRSCRCPATVAAVRHRTARPPAVARWAAGAT
eukprot:109366-Prymnesium_polylepis.1